MVLSGAPWYRRGVTKLVLVPREGPAHPSFTGLRRRDGVEVLVGFDEPLGRSAIEKLRSVVHGWIGRASWRAAGGRARFAPIGVSGEGARIVFTGAPRPRVVLDDHVRVLPKHFSVRSQEDEGARMRRAAIGVALALALLESPSAAEEPSGAAADKPAERRSGVVLGMEGGLGLGSASGYPNSARFIDKPDFHSATGAMFGSGGTFFVMGALADTFNVGLWLGGGTFRNEDFESSGGGLGLRFEAFPLWTMGKELRDLGVRAQVGVGAGSIEIQRPGSWPNAEGAQSYLGLGVFYEATRIFGNHVALGPAIDYDVIFSRSLTRHALILGARFAFYGGP